MMDNHGPDERIPERPLTSGIAEGVRAFVKQMTDLGRRAEPLRHLLEPSGIRAEAPGGEVAVTVTAGGALIAVDFGAGHEEMDEDDLAALVLATYDRALADAERHRREGIEETA
ncbi:YbaB/EbfC family nucleoid-associated protein [Glycomyces harbinensis]|uniref:YbaB/EbfC DNA-binding family protein n=1 Tax=Glycomyces harbinensis TaxID=58114 RepID=A0A1G7BG13_9ACTN|nr:YbaB/EbfC family nucleoid-associated protein [Glycomyces harbinensis]SDE25912.1 YbaB/EbfC DNA-binding family protein [Glycomyces harbinensis]